MIISTCLAQSCSSNVTFTLISITQHSPEVYGVFSNEYNKIIPTHTNVNVMYSRKVTCSIFIQYLWSEIKG